jgi:hypothetical protein
MLSEARGPDTRASLLRSITRAIMTSTEILGPPSTVDAPQSLHSMEALAGLPLPTKGQEAIELSNCFNAAAQKEQLSAMNVGVQRIAVRA